MYLSEQEKSTKNVIENNLQYFNKKRRKNKLFVKYYISDGNKADLLKDNKMIVCCEDFKTVCIAISAIINYIGG